MFPRLKTRIGTALLPHLDLLVEFSTLGEYGIGEDGRPLALRQRLVSQTTSRRRGDCLPSLGAESSRSRGDRPER